MRVVFSACREVGLRACDLGLRADFRREDFAIFGARGFCGDRRVARLLDFGLRSRGGIRLYLLRGPSVAASVSERIEDPAKHATDEVRCQHNGIASALIEGAIVGTRGPGLRKSEANRHGFGTLSLVVEPGHAEADSSWLEPTARRAEIVGLAVNLLVRDLVNNTSRREVAGAVSRSHQHRGWRRRHRG